MIRMLVTAAAALLLTSAAAAAHQPAPPPPDMQPTAKPKIDVVFALDTTGSMAGLINGAKQKVWSIVNTLATAQPTPEIRVGIVAYRDRGDAYVTQRTALTTDLDKVYASLMALQADGGGDTPESVNQALHESITRFQWAKGGQSLRMVFLVGDAPPHMDYQDDVRYDVSLSLAREKDIVVHAVQCGNMGSTTPVWKRIAANGGGDFSRVAQSGDAFVRPTKYDKKLASLQAELDATRLVYGARAARKDAEKRTKLKARLREVADEGALAQRAAYNASKAGARNQFGASDLLSDLAAGKVTLADVPAAKLPAELRALSPAQRKAFVAKRAAHRAKLRKQIAQLDGKRQAVLKAEAKRTASTRGRAFEEKVYDSVKKSGAKKGMSFDMAY